MIWIRGADPKENNSQSGADPCGKKVRIRLRDKTVQIRPNETDPWHVHTACLKISTFYNMSQGCNRIPVISEFAFWQRRKPVSCVPPPRIRPQNAEKLPAPAYDNYYGENMYAAGPEEGGGYAWICIMLKKCTFLTNQAELIFSQQQ